MAFIAIIKDARQLGAHYRNLKNLLTSLRFRVLYETIVSVVMNYVETR